MSRDDHLQAVQKWLRDNVLAYETPTAVEVSDFQLGANGFSGSFQVTLDGKKLPVPFSFGLGDNGKPALHFPMFCSPLGAPASYEAVELTDETTLAIERLLRFILPKMKPLGYDRETGELIVLTTHSTLDRIVNRAEYDECMRRVSGKEFSARCFVGDAQQGDQANGPAPGGSAA